MVGKVWGLSVRLRVHILMCILKINKSLFNDPSEILSLGNLAIIYSGNKVLLTGEVIWTIELEDI